MEKTFQALWANTPDSDSNNFQAMTCEVRNTTLDELSTGEVVLKAEYSGVNYKDALAVTGKGKILRQLPLIPGIDVAGTVVESRSQQFKEGDPVLVNGANMGEKLCGGFSKYLRLPADMILKRPDGLSAREAMIFGTAGFTAALAIHQMELNGLRPEKGEVLVTGATGGVGSLALSFLNQLGYETEAWTRREEHREWLHACGAAKVTDISDWDLSTRPLESVRWAGAIDNVGGEILSYILPRIDLWGSVGSIGLASSEQLHSTVFPFILRGVNLLGVSSNNCPPQLRNQIWQKIAGPMKPKNLEHMLSQEITLQQIPTTAQAIIRGEHRGRILVTMK
jgi:NADPH2:quinone reductase